MSSEFVGLARRVPDAVSVLKRFWESEVLFKNAVYINGLCISCSSHLFFSLLSVQWEAFSLPELQNFLRILDKEENEQLQILKKRYAAYRDKLEEALGGVWKPG